MLQCSTGLMDREEDCFCLLTKLTLSCEKGHQRKLVKNSGLHLMLFSTERVNNLIGKCFFLYKRNCDIVIEFL